jgi:hypothetical protein
MVVDNIILWLCVLTVKFSGWKTKCKSHCLNSFHSPVTFCVVHILSMVVPWKRVTTWIRSEALCLRIAYKAYLMKMNIWKWQCHSHKFSICCIKEYLWKKLEFKMSMTNVIICGCFVIFTMPTKFSLVIIVVPQGWSTHWEIKSLRRLLKAI